MEVIKNLLIRFRQSGVLLLIGLFLIIYIAFGFVYWQQGAQQRDIEEKTTNISLILARSLPSKEELRAEYDEVNSALTSITDSADAIAMLVGIAEKSGIDTDNDKLSVPSATTREETVGESTYQVFSFKNVSVQGDYDTVMTFISDLDSGTTQETLVLKRVDINQIEVRGEGEERTRIETKATLDVDLYTKL